MICLESQHFNVQKILLLIIGLWPFQQTNFVRLRFIFLTSILITACLFQFTAFVTLECTSDIIFKIFSPAIYILLILIKYIWFRINMETVRNLLIQLQYIYNELKDENEIAIIKRYGYNAKYYTIALTVVIFCGTFLIIVIQCWTDIVNVVLPTNESRSHYLYFVAEYFIDQEKHFYLILFHINTSFFIGGFVLSATGMTLFAYFQHICGMFKVSSYRIKQAITIDMMQNIIVKKDNVMLKKIICAVDIHRQAMKLSQVLISRFEMMFFWITPPLVMCLSINLFRIFQIVSTRYNIDEVILPSLLAFIAIAYMFLAHYTGQDVTNHNNYVIAAAYDTQWYIAPLHIQKLILFLLQRGTKDFTLNIGGLLIASLECFATLIKASISYFTVIYSMR
ncbi:Or9e92 [Eciton burchellii]|nr:Or9e92 [Eciton burchellii]